MIRHLLTFFALLLFGAQLEAQAVPVRSGEHVNFTRLVLHIPKGTRWDVIDREEGLEVSLDLPAPRFLTEQVFTRIDRVRISSLHPNVSGKGLLVSLSCDCEASASLLGERMIVIDVADRNTPRSSLEADETVVGTPVAGPDLSSPTLPTLTEILKRQRISPLPRIEVGSKHLRDLRVVQAYLIAGMERLAPLPLTEKSSGDTSAIRGEEGVTSRLSGAANIRVHSTDTTIQPLTLSTSCLENSVARLPKLTEPQEVWQEIARLNRMLAEPSKIDAGQDLARMYISIGFGAEALLILDSIEASERTLTSMAQLIDHPGPRPSSLFVGMSGCDTSAALWSVLANDRSLKRKHVNEQALLATFMELPVSLRRHLGPYLIGTLRKIGLSDLSETIIVAMDRSELPVSDTLQLAMAETSSKHMEARKVLDSLISSGSEESAQALILRINLAWADETDIAPGSADIVKTFLFESRDSGVFPDLIRAQVRALSLEGRYSDSLKVARESKELHLGNYSAVVTDIFEALTHRSSDITFLNNVFEVPQTTLQTVQMTALAAMAERVYNLGFTERAAEIIRISAENTRTDAHKLLLARFAMREGRLNQARAELIGAQGDSVERLRAELASQVPATTRQTLDQEIQTRAVNKKIPSALDLVTEHNPLVEAAEFLSKSRNTRREVLKTLEGGEG